MAIKKKKKMLKKPVKPVVKSSGIVTTVIISLVIVAAAAAAGIAVTKAREKALNTGTTGVTSTVSPETITITDTATGKTSKMEVKPASAGSSQTNNPNVTLNKQVVPIDHNQAALNAAVRVSEAAKTGDYSYLLKAVETKETIPHIDISEAKYLFDSGKALFVDARGAAEYDEAHVKGSVNIPVIATAEEVEKLKAKLANKVLVTYCHGVGCHLADKTAYKLWDAGYRKIAIFFGGWPKWNEHKYPIVTKSK